MKIDQDLELGQLALHPADLKPDGVTRKRPPRVALTFSHEGDDGAELAGFFADPTSAGVLHVKIETEDGSREWAGFGRLGKLTMTPPNRDRAQEAGAHPRLSFPVIFEDNGETDLGELMLTRLRMAKGDTCTAHLVAEVWQGELPWEKGLADGPG